MEKVSLVTSCISKIAFKRALFPEKCFNIENTSVTMRKGSHPGVDGFLDKFAELEKSYQYIYSITMAIVKNRMVKESWVFYLKNEDPVQGSWDKELDYLGPIDAGSVILQAQYTSDCPAAFKMGGFIESKPIIDNNLEERLGTIPGNILVSFWQDNDQSDVRTDFSCSTAESGMMMSESELQGTDPNNGHFLCICSQLEEPNRQSLIRCTQCTNICHFYCMGHFNPKSNKGFKCPECNPKIAPHLKDPAYSQYLSQLGLLRKLIRYFWIAQDDVAFSLQALSTDLITPFDDLKQLVTHLQVMNFGRFLVNHKLITCSRMEDVSPKMEMQIQKTRESNEIVKKVFTDEYTSYEYFNSFPNANDLWKSFNQVQPATMPNEM